MPRQITPRQANVVIPTVTAQHINMVRIDAPVDPATGAIDLNRTHLVFKIQELQSDGLMGAIAERDVLFSQWPANIRQTIVTLRNQLYAAAEAQGWLDSGTDTGELTP